MFDISNENATKTIKRLYFVKCNRFFIINEGYSFKEV